MARGRFSVAVCLLMLGNVWASRNYSIEQKIRDESDLSQFYTMLESNQLALSTIKFTGVTVFAPVNSAFQEENRNFDDVNNLVLYHITNTPLMLNNLGESVNTIMSGNPPLWITRNKKDIYINNAKVIERKSNFHHVHRGNKQVMHVIDKVLEVVKYNSKEPPRYNPDALEFLNEAEEIELGDHRLRNFRQRVSVKLQQNVFSTAGRHTFFIPVDEGFQPQPRPDKIDELVIRGHVIKDHVLFTDPTPDNQEYRTLAFTDKIKVNVSFSTERDNRHYVKSNTIVGDANHPEGVVLAEIVKGNIPVKNGVVHLIHRPLMVVDTTVTQFLEDREDGPLYKFFEVIRDVEGDFMDRLTGMRELTLFAPSNAAWKDPSLTNILRDKKKIKEILHMHLVEEKLPMEKIVYSNRRQVPTLTPRRNLYFNVLQVGNNRTLTVEGGGVNATVIQPDIAATNGIVHIIDKVLGVPFTTVGRKLATDPMMNKTYILGKIQGFNTQLDEMTKRFTYFVPRDYAWSRMESRYPSAHKKLFMNDFAYHAKQILERHLVVADKPFMMADLRNMTMYNSIQLPTVRDVVKIKVIETDKSYQVEWNNEKINVFRPDVECTNGVIHVIDTVFLRDNDIYVTGSNSEILQPLRVILGFFVCLLMSQYL